MANDAENTGKQVVVEAATVIVFRNAAAGPPEILMVQRANSLSFAGSAVVFPGGKVDESDRATARRLRAVDIDVDDAAARIAGIREMIEETGLVIGTSRPPNAAEAESARTILSSEPGLERLLDRFGWALDLDALVPFARWVPTFKPGRIYDTRFYLADIGTGNVALSPDLGENTHLFWASAKETLAMIEAGDIKAIYPTRRNLERLAQFASFAEASVHARALSGEIIAPWIVRAHGVDMLHIPEGIGYPVCAAPLAQISID